jgi:hypothetical protein
VRRGRLEYNGFRSSESTPRSTSSLTYRRTCRAVGRSARDKLEFMRTGSAIFPSRSTLEEEYIRPTTGRPPLVWPTSPAACRLRQGCASAFSRLGPLRLSLNSNTLSARGPLLPRSAPAGELVAASSLPVGPYEDRVPLFMEASCRDPRTLSPRSSYALTPRVPLPS